MAKVPKGLIESTIWDEGLPTERITFRFGTPGRGHRFWGLYRVTVYVFKQSRFPLPIYPITSEQAMSDRLGRAVWATRYRWTVPIWNWLYDTWYGNIYRKLQIWATGLWQGGFIELDEWVDTSIRHSLKSFSLRPSTINRRISTRMAEEAQWGALRIQQARQLGWRDQEAVWKSQFYYVSLNDPLFDLEEG